MPALAGRHTPGDLERELFALPVRHGGLGVTHPVKCADSEYNNSVKMVAPLTKLLIRQQHGLEDVCGTIIPVRNSQRPSAQR